MTIPKQSIRHIPIADLIPHPSNIRDDEADNLTELAASIYEHGIIQPLAVTEHPTEPDKWLVLAGHRRRRAAREAGLSHVPCVIRHDLDADVAEQLVVMLVENCQRRDLGPVEKAEAFEQLRTRGLSVSAIARRTGLAQPTVSYYLSLLDLDPRTLEQVRAGIIPVTQAIDAVREVRRTTRRRDKRPQVGRPVVLEPPHLTRKHPLAKLVAERCDHTSRPKVGSVGCGQCWEEAIRADAQLGDLDADVDGAVAGTEYDEVAVERRLSGDRTGTLSHADRVEIVRRARDRGWSIGQIQEVAGMSDSTVKRILRQTREEQAATPEAVSA